MVKKKKIKEKKSFLGFVTKVLVVITVIAFLMAAFRIREYSRDYSFGYKVDQYVWDLQDNDFGELYRTAVSDMARGKTYSEEVEECRALGFYFEQAVLEKAYRDNGLDEKADVFKARKGAYAADLGSLASKAKEADALLGK